MLGACRSGLTEPESSLKVDFSSGHACAAVLYAGVDRKPLQDVPRPHERPEEKAVKAPSPAQQLLEVTMWSSLEKGGIRAEKFLICSTWKLHLNFWHVPTSTCHGRPQYVPCLQTGSHSRNV